MGVRIGTQLALVNRRGRICLQEEMRFSSVRHTLRELPMSSSLLGAGDTEPKK